MQRKKANWGTGLFPCTLRLFLLNGAAGRIILGC